ncbi:uncharacterized protein si:ch211-149e23.4 isoform X2 [Anguilla rostrata]|uniref:uncharacterized protein si:ch211-149e23.4 isoform X2 n=1 Tax=Anguilla rostrata TaxID=7938 RepID=UPI0030CDCBD9
MQYIIAMLMSHISLNASNMIVLALQLLGFAINVWAQSTGEVDVDVLVEVERNVTGVLGEEVVLRCQYTGQEQLIMSAWKKRETRSRGWLAGYHASAPFTKHQDFGLPASPTNLSVTVNITSLEAEGEYICVFISMMQQYEQSVFLTVLARPDVHTNVTETVENGTHYQTASCSAVAGKPAAAIGWSVDGDRVVAGGNFSVSETTVRHGDGTSTRTSELRFPTHLLEEGADVECVVGHPALRRQDVMETARVQTFIAPNVTLVTQEGGGGEGEELREVSCVATGGRPAPKVTLLLSGDASEGPAPVVREERDEETGVVTVTSSVTLRGALLHEGERVSCVVTHPKLTGELQRAITLPTYELSSVRLFRQHSAGSAGSAGSAVSSAELHPGNEVEGQVVMTEGQTNVNILFEVDGNVPRYQVTCAREDGSLLEGVEVTGRFLHFEGPIEPRHAGLYTCKASYYSHTLSVPLEIVVTPKVVEPAVVPPSIKIQTREDVDHRTVECSASDAYPAANVSWVLPEGPSGTVRSNSAFRNGSHSVASALRLPACVPRELTVECVVEHPALAAPERRAVTLPACVSPDVTVSSRTVWDEGVEYTEVRCSVGGVERGDAAVSWRVGGGDCAGCAGELPESMLGNRTGSVLRLPTQLVAGRVVACLVDHPAFGTPERQEIWVPSAGAFPSSGYDEGRGTFPSPHTPQSPVSLVPVVSLVRLKTSAQWQAVCELTRARAAGRAAVSWVLPENSTGRAAFRSGYEGGSLWARSTYEFPLARHEGRNLTCLTRDGHGTTETTLHVPQFYISSLRVLNRTTSYHWPQEEGPVTYRVALQAHTPGQRILLRVYGNVPQHNITCTRRDGSAVRVVGVEMLFPQKVSEKDSGLYTCHASFYHHSATVLIHVEVTSDDLQLWMLAAICFSSAAAVSLVVLVSLCVFCKRADGEGSRSKASHGKRESLAHLTPLVQDPCSPELKKQPVSGQRSPEYADLVRYSIIIDVKSAV